MQQLDTIIFLLAALAGLYTAAEKFRIPYPIILVLSGLGIGFIPGLPIVELSPEIVFLVFLPPLLFDAARNTAWHDFKKQKASIGRLAFGLVIFSTAGVAIGAHYLIPGFTWPLAILLGAIVSPPDVVAATSAIKGLRLPRRMVTILEGESLINDASALIIYRFALATVLGSAFSVSAISMQFLMVALSGVAIGLAFGFIYVIIQKKILTNSTVETSATLILPFVSYLIAEHLGASGVLSVVTTGLLISRRSHEIFIYKTRIKMTQFWDVIIFLLNGLIFILIGMQLHTIMSGIARHSLLDLLTFSAIIAGITIVLRLVWVYFSVWTANFLLKIMRKSFEPPSVKDLFIIGWSGMRGVVSLASALAIPLVLPGGEEFPQRDTILFITFFVIFTTLVIQGATLPFFVRKLGVQETESHAIMEERKLRLVLAEEAVSFINNKSPSADSDPVVEEIKTRFERQINYLNGVLEDEDTPEDNGLSKHEFFERYMKYERAVIEHQRKHIIGLSKGTDFSHHALRRVEAELDAWNLNVAERRKALRKPT